MNLFSARLLSQSIPIVFSSCRPNGKWNTWTVRRMCRWEGSNVWQVVRRGITFFRWWVIHKPCVTSLIRSDQFGPFASFFLFLQDRWVVFSYFSQIWVVSLIDFSIFYLFFIAQPIEPPCFFFSVDMNRNFNPRTPLDVVLSTLTWYSQVGAVQRRPMPQQPSIQFLVNAAVAVTQGRPIPPVPRQLEVVLLQDVGMLIEDISGVLRLVAAFRRAEEQMYRDGLHLAIEVELQIVDSIDRNRPMFEWEEMGPSSAILC